MARTTTITAIRTLLRIVDGYKRNSSAPVISKNADGSICIFFHQFGQATLATRCEERLKDNGFRVTNCYPRLIISA